MRSSNDGSSSQQKSLPSSSNNADSSNDLSSTTTTKSLSEQQDLIKQEPIYSSYIPNNYKSRVLLSFDEHDNYYGPYLPASNKQRTLLSQQKLAAPGYTYSSSVEKYINKNFKLTQEEKTSTVFSFTFE